MKTILALAAMLVFALPVAAQDDCRTQPKPPKPLTPAGCIDTTPTCLCAGTICRWTWACIPRGLPSMAAPPELPAVAPSRIDPTIPLQVSPPQMPDLMDTMLKVEQLRQLQGQNEKPLLPMPPSSGRLPVQVADVASMKTMGNWNGRAWLSFFPENHRWAYVDAVRETLTIDAPEKVTLYFAGGTTNGQIAEAITSFYANDGHLWVPIHYALWAARLKLEGADSSKLEEFVSVLKKAFSENTK